MTFQINICSSSFFFINKDACTLAHYSINTICTSKVPAATLFMRVVIASLRLGTPGGSVGCLSSRSNTTLTPAEDTYREQLIHKWTASLAYYKNITIARLNSFDN